MNCKEVPDEMVHSDQRERFRPGNALRGLNADEQRT
jgi:hypothetical protein